MAERLRCAICRAEGGTRPGGDWYACRSCGTSFRNEPLTRGELERYYRDAFCSEEGAMRATSPEIASQYTRLIEQAAEDLVWRRSRILDYGAGEGYLTARLKELGAEVVAVEPYGTPPVAADGTTAYRSLDELDDEEPFDGIVMTEVIEHLSDPLEVVRKLRSLLRNDGWCFVTTPNVESLKSRLLRGRWSERRKRGHLYLFSQHGLERGLRQAGFERVTSCRGTVSFSSSKGRSLLQRLLQRMRLDGQLRVMAWNVGGGSHLGN